MIINPYEEEGIWLKGNLHTHTINSKCGHYPLEKVISLYKSYKLKYDFLAITDHYYLTSLKEAQETERDLILIQGVEFKSNKSQTLGINLNTYEDDKESGDNYQELFNKVSENGAINIICHPHLYHDDYWPLEKLLTLENYIGIEVYNNNVKMDNSGRAVASDLWDDLLSNGKKVFGFADDDMHVFSRVGGGFNMVLSKEKTKESIMQSIKKGSFYASSGVFLDEIIVNENKICVSTKNIPVEIRFIGKNKRLLKSVFDISAEYECMGDEGYVRVELYREDGAKAWLQPLFLSSRP